MGRQHPEGLQQRDGQRDDHHGGDHAHEVAEYSRQQNQRCKGGHGGEHRRGDGCCDLAQCIECRLHRIHAVAQAVIDPLDDDHRIVDQHAEHDHHAKQDHHIQGLADQREHPEGAGKDEGNADGGQQGDSRAEKQPGHDQNQGQADQGVGLHQADRIAGGDGLVVDQYQFYTGGVGEPVAALEVDLQALDQFDGVGVCLLEHGKHHRRPVLVGRQLIGFGARAFHPGDIGQFDFAAGGDDGARGQPARVGIRADQSDQPVAVAQTRVAGGDVLKKGAHGIGHLAWCQAKFLQPLWVKAYLQFRVGQADGVDTVDPRQTLHGFAYVACLATQVLVQRAADYRDRGRGITVGAGDLQDL